MTTKPNLIGLALGLGLVFSPNHAEASLPDLCDDVFLDEIGAPLTDAAGMTFSRFCTPYGPDAPIWADHVCCAIDGNDADCKPTDPNGRCTTGLKMWCDYAEQVDSHVTCYQPLPDACAAGYCTDDMAPGSEPAAATTPLCCFGGTCYELSWGEHCGGYTVMCDAPYTDSEGNVGCADND